MGSVSCAQILSHVALRQLRTTDSITELITALR